MARRFTVTRLAWTDPPLGEIDLPEGRLEMVAGFGSGLARRAGDAPGILWAIGDRGPNLKVDVALDRYGLRLEGRHQAIDGAKIMPRPDIGPALAELRLTGDRVELVRTMPIRGASGRAISGLPGPGSAHAVTEPALDLAGDLLPPDPSGADTEGIVALADGGFIVGDEYGPSLLRLDAAGTVLERWVPAGREGDFTGADYPVRGVLPAIAAQRRLNRGFEGSGAVARWQAVAPRLSEPARASRRKCAPQGAPCPDLDARRRYRCAPGTVPLSAQSSGEASSVITVRRCMTSR